MTLREINLCVYPSYCLIVVRLYFALLDWVIVLMTLVLHAVLCLDHLLVGCLP